MTRYTKILLPVTGLVGLMSPAYAQECATGPATVGASGEVVLAQPIS